MPSNEQFLDIYQFPEQLREFTADWDVVILPEQTKMMLLNYVTALSRLGYANASSLALRRAVLLYGPPGCGKTSLARGLPAKWFTSVRVPKAGFIHVNTHALFSGDRGGGQERVLQAFQQIAEQASSGFPIFVLIDEVETLGTDRASISFEANPLDALYQVTAFFESFDKLTRTLPNLVFIFTTNIPKAIDRAVRERVDFSVEIPLPGTMARSQILADAVQSLNGAFDVTGLTHMAGSPSDPRWMDLIAHSEGLSGRSLRHLVVLAATYAVHSRTLDLGHLQNAITQVREVEQSLSEQGGVYLERYQRSETAESAPPEAIKPPPPSREADSHADDADAVRDRGLDEPMSRLSTEITDLRAEVAQIRELLQYGANGQSPSALADDAALNHSRRKRLGRK